MLSVTLSTGKPRLMFKGLTPPKILIVDDMPAVRSLLRDMLGEMGLGHGISEAEDGDQAWTMIQQVYADPFRCFDLVIADWSMPGLSGVDLLRAVRSHAGTRDLPFLMITARGDGAHISEAILARVTDYIVKPFNGAQLGEKLSQILSHGSSLRLVKS